MELKQCVTPKEEEVAAKVIDGEAIIINLASGNYYSMDNTGAFIWEMINNRNSLETILTSIAARYEVDRKQAETDLRQLVTELLQENLICLSDDPAPAHANGAAESIAKSTYAPPKLNAYRDMGDLLALDPPVPGLGDLAWKKDDSEPSR